MDFQVDWTDPALADLEEIVAYIARDNPEAAERVGHGIVDHVETLQTFPLIGPPYPRGSAGEVREIVYRKYRVFYRVDESKKKSGDTHCLARRTRHAEFSEHLIQ